MGSHNEVISSSDENITSELESSDGDTMKDSDKKVEENGSKSGRFQSAIDELADIQRNIEHGLSLLRLNDWLNVDPSDIREEDKVLYEAYTSRIENLRQRKNGVIDGMLGQIKQDDRYKNLSEDDLNRIRDHIYAGSTRFGFYFNDESINEIISDK